jgi:hypothetical protein
MAEPNYGLLDTSLPYKVGGSVVKGMGDVNALRAQQLQNQAAEFEIKNALAEQEAYKQAAQGGVGVSQALMERGLGGKAAAYQKSTAEAQKLGLEGQLKKVEIQYARNSQLAADPSDQNIIGSLQQQIRSGEISPDQAQQAWSQVQMMNPEQRTQYFTKMSMSAQQLLSTTLRQQEADTSRQRLQFEMDPTRQGQISAAKAGGAETGKSSAQAAANLPSAIQTANEAITLIDEMVGKAPVVDKSGKVIEKGTAPHPGFSSYVGATLTPGMRFLEGSDAASYEVRQKQIEGQAFLEAFRSLKGGGSITEKEGEKATAAITRMNKASSEKEYIQAARELQQILRTGVENAKKKAARGTVGGGPLPKNKWADALAEFEAQENQ